MWQDEILKLNFNNNKNFITTKDKHIYIFSDSNLYKECNEREICILSLRYIRNFMLK